MNRFFEFTSPQLRVLLGFTALMVLLSFFYFIKDNSRVDERSLNFSVQIGDDDTRYATVLKVDLNKSPADSLELLPGIGPALAERIVAARDSLRFVRIDDIVRVPGIGRKTLEKIKPYIEVTPW